MSHIQRCVVICRNNEDIQWVRDFWTTSMIYNKGLPIQVQRVPVVQQPREGGDALSIINFILDHYEDELPQVAVFIKGNIQEHIPLYTDGGYPATPQPFIERLVQEAHTHGMSQNTIAIDHPETSPTYRIPLIRSGFSYTGMTFGEWMEKTLLHPFPTHSFRRYPSTCFAIRKDLIQRHPKMHYQAIKKQLNVEISEFIKYLRNSWYYTFATPPPIHSIDALPPRIAVICHGITYTQAHQEGQLIYSVHALPCLQQVHAHIIAPIREAGKTVTTYLFTNPHQHLQQFAQTLDRNTIVKTRDDITVANSWPEARRYLTNLWTDYDFFIVLRADIFLLQPIHEWRIDPTKHNMDGGKNLLEAFPLNAVQKHNMIPSYYTVTTDNYPLYISHLRHRPLLATK